MIWQTRMEKELRAELAEAKKEIKELKDANRQLVNAVLEKAGYAERLEVQQEIKVGVEKPTMAYLDFRRRAERSGNA